MMHNEVLLHGTSVSKLQTNTLRVNDWQLLNKMWLIKPNGNSVPTTRGRPSTTDGTCTIVTELGMSDINFFPIYDIMVMCCKTGGGVMCPCDNVWLFVYLQECVWTAVRDGESWRQQHFRSRKECAAATLSTRSVDRSPTKKPLLNSVGAVRCAEEPFQYYWPFSFHVLFFSFFFFCSATLVWSDLLQHVLILRGPSRRTEVKRSVDHIVPPC